MAECKVTVDAGVCKMKTVIIAKTNEDGEVELDIQSDCSKVLEMPCPLCSDESNRSSR